MKKYIISILLIVGSTSLLAAQEIDYNEHNGYIAEGYDVVSYFLNNPTEGSKLYKITYKGAIFKFSSQKNLDLFKANSDKYIPQYGGWCSYTVASKNKKVSSDPETYEIRNGKLYLFYNSFFKNAHESWLAENPNKLIIKADNNWLNLKEKK